MVYLFYKRKKKQQTSKQTKQKLLTCMLIVWRCPRGFETGGAGGAFCSTHDVTIFKFHVNLFMLTVFIILIFHC